MRLSSKLLVLLLALGVQAGDTGYDDVGYAEYPDVHFDLYKTSQCKSAGIKGAEVLNITLATDGGGPDGFGKVFHIRSWRAKQLDYNTNGIPCYANLYHKEARQSKASGSGILKPGKPRCIDLPHGPIDVRSVAAYCVGQGK